MFIIDAWLDLLCSGGSIPRRSGTEERVSCLAGPEQAES